MRSPYTRSLTGWLVGLGASVLADQVFFLSLTWAALQIGSAAEVGVVLASGSLPRLLILLVGGAFADHVSPKRIVIGTDTGRALVMAAAAVGLMLTSMSTWQLVLVALAIGGLGGFFLPAVGALPARIAPPELMGQVAALRTVTQRVAMLLGGPLAGWLIYLYGPSAAFWGSAVLFAVSVASLALVTTVLRTRPDPDPAERAREEVAAARTSTGTRETMSSGPASDCSFLVRFRDALGPVRRDPLLGWLLLLVAGMNLGFAGPVTAGLPLLAAGGWGPRGAGLLLGGFGLGAAAAGLGLVFVHRIPRAGWVALASVGTMGLALTSVSVVRTLPCALLGTVVLGLASGVFGTLVHAMVLTRTARSELGRVMSLLSLSVEGVVPVSFAATGVLAQALGPHAVFVAGGVVILATTALVLTRPEIRAFAMARAAADPVAASDVLDDPTAPTGPLPRQEAAGATALATRRRP